MNNTGQNKVVIVQFNKKFIWSSLIKRFRKIENGPIYFSYYMELLASSLADGGKIHLFGEQLKFTSPAHELADRICVPDCEIPLMAAALKACQDLNLITFLDESGPIKIEFDLVAAFTRACAKEIIHEEELNDQNQQTIPEGGTNWQPPISGTEDTIGVGCKTRKQQKANEMFERLWRQYPRKRGKDKISAAVKMKLYKVGEEACEDAIEAYKKEKAGIDLQYIQHGSTFFRTGIWDYLRGDASLQANDE